MTTDADDEQTVWATRSGTVYHTDPDCRTLNGARRVTNGPLWYYDDRGECSYCADSREHNASAPGSVWEDATGRPMGRRTPESTGVTQTPTPGRPDPDTCPWPDCSGPVRDRPGRRGEACYACNRPPGDAPDPATTDRPRWALP